MCADLGIDSHLHAMRHYRATELITAGIDIRTVTGRLGHGGGGTTTLRVYTAWVAHSDKNAADLLARRFTAPRSMKLRALIPRAKPSTPVNDPRARLTVRPSSPSPVAVSMSSTPCSKATAPTTPVTARQRRDER